MTLDTSVTTTLLAEEVERIVSEHPERPDLVIAYLNGKHKWERITAKNMVEGYRGVRLPKLQVLCKVMELMQGADVPQMKIYTAAAVCLSVKRYMLERCVRLIPMGFRPTAKKDPMAAKNVTVTRTLTEQQMDLVQQIMSDILGSGPVVVDHDALVASGQTADRGTVQTDVPLTAAAGIAGPVMSTQLAEVAQCPATAPAAGRLATNPDAHDVLADLAALGQANISGFDLGTMLNQLGALARFGMSRVEDASEVERLRAEHTKLMQENAFLRQANSRLTAEIAEMNQCMAAVEDEAQAKITAAQATFAAHEAVMRETFDVRRQVLESEYEAFKTMVDDFVQLGSVQQITTLGEFRTRLVYTLDRFGNVIMAERMVS